MAKKRKGETVGWRVKTGGHYIQRTIGDTVYADTVKGPLLRKAEAYRLMADWLDAGYIPRLVRVFVRR